MTRSRSLTGSGIVGYGATRPETVVAVVGTATEIGKTWTSAALAVELRARGVSVAARKPVQSHDPADATPTDAAVLADATGVELGEVCAPEWTLPVPMAPPMAADVLGLATPSLDELVASVGWPSPTVAVGLVETVGGVAAPLAADADSLDLVVAVEPDLVLLVAHAGLGTINDVRLSLGAIAARSPRRGRAPALDRRVVVHLNRYDADVDLHRRNRAWLTDVDGCTVTTTVADLADRVHGASRHGPVGSV